MENKVVNLEVKDNLGSLKSQLREAQAEVAALSDKFGATSREAINAAKKAGELKDRIGDAKALTDAFNPDAKFKALTASLSGVAGGFSAVQGGMALLGVESENAEAALLKVQSAMALSQGAQAVGESVDSFKQLGAVIKNTTIVQGLYNFVQTGSFTAITANTVATEAQATATVASTVATTGASTALKILRVALIGTGIGAIVIGLIALYQNFDKVKNAVLGVIPGLAKFGNFISNVSQQITDFVGATSDSSRALDKLKKDANATLSTNKKFMQEHGDQVDQYTAKKIKAKDDYAKAIQEDGANVKELAKRLNRELLAADEERTEDAKKARQKQKTQTKKDNSEALAEQKAFQDALKAQSDARTANENEVTQAIGDALDKQSEKGMSATDIEIRNINDKYFRLNELAIQQGRSEEERAILQRQKQNEIDAQKKIKSDADAVTKKAEDEKKLADAKAQAEKELAIDNALQQAKRNALNTGLDLLQQFAGKNKAVALGILAVQKGLAIADIIVGASKSIAISKANLALIPPILPTGIPNPAYPVAVAGNLKSILTTKIGAATSIASILAAGISGAKSITGGGSSGGGSSSSGGGGGSASQPPAFNVVGASSTNQLAQTIAGQQQQPIKAYVVANDVTTQQSLDRNIVQSATIG